MIQSFLFLPFWGIVFVRSSDQIIITVAWNDATLAYFFAHAPNLQSSVNLSPVITTSHSPRVLHLLLKHSRTPLSRMAKIRS